VDALERSPIKGEIFGAGLLGSHARRLARRHTLAPIARPQWLRRRDRGPLIAQLDATERALTAARDTLARASADGADVGPVERQQRVVGHLGHGQLGNAEDRLELVG